MKEKSSAEGVRKKSVGRKEGMPVLFRLLDGDPNRWSLIDILNMTMTMLYDLNGENFRGGQGRVAWPGTYMYL